MPPKKKMNGSELLAELGAGAIDRVPSPEPAAATATTGRPPKVTGGGKGVPLTVPVSKEHAEALGRAALAQAQAIGGRTTVTRQDIVRMLIERAVSDPSFPANIVEQDPS